MSKEPETQGQQEQKQEQRLFPVVSVDYLLREGHVTQAEVDAVRRIDGTPESRDAYFGIATSK